MNHLLAFAAVASVASSLAPIPRVVSSAIRVHSQNLPGGESETGASIGRRTVLASASSILLALTASCQDAYAIDPFKAGRPDAAEGLEDNWLTRMDRGSAGGETQGVAPPPKARSKDGHVETSLQSPLTGGAVAVSFDSPWKERRGSVASYGDAKKNQDAFVALSALPRQKSSAKVGEISQAVVLDAIFGRDSRFGTYGAPTNIKVRSDESAGQGDLAGLRVLDISFTSQGAQLEVDKRVAVGVRMAGGSAPVLALLVAGSSKAKWAESEQDAKAMVATFKAQ